MTQIKCWNCVRMNQRDKERERWVGQNIKSHKAIAAAALVVKN